MSEHIFGQEPGLKSEALKSLVRVTLELAAIQVHMDANSSTKRRLKRCEAALISIAKIQGVPVKDFQEAIMGATAEIKGKPNENASGSKPTPDGDVVVPMRK
jgi:hypothetical protein